MSNYIYENCILYKTERHPSGVIDGDTVEIEISKSCGFGVVTNITLRFRLNGINAPEIRGGTIESKLLAKAAKERIEELLSGKTFTIESHKTSKYGLWLADIFTILASGELVHLNQLLVDEGLAKAYDGQSPRTYIQSD